MIKFDISVRHKKASDDKEEWKKIVKKFKELYTGSYTLSFNAECCVFILDWQNDMTGLVMLAEAAHILNHLGCYMKPTDGVTVCLSHKGYARLNFNKFALKLPEEDIYKVCPDRRGKNGAKSVAVQWPSDPDVICNAADIYDVSNFRNTEYGICTAELSDGVLRIGYFGGKDFLKQPYPTCRMIEQIIGLCDAVIDSPEYTKSDSELLQKRWTERSAFASRFMSLEAFKAGTHCNLTCNLEPVTDAITFGKLRKGVYHLYVELRLDEVGDVDVNYDGDTGKFQVRKCSLPDGVVCSEPTDFAKCKVNDGSFNGGVFVECKLNGGKYKGVFFGNDTEVTGADILQSLISRGAVVKDSTVFSTDIDGTVKNCRLSQGCRYTAAAEFENTERKGCRRIDNSEDL